MGRIFFSLISLFVGLVFLLNYAATAFGEEFYKGKTVRFIVGQEVGGGYDTYTRSIARHIGRHIPGNPYTIVQNMTGAGSLIAANYMYSNAAPDGLSVWNWNSAFILNQALGDPNVRLDGRQIGWIGAPSKGIPVCVVMRFTGLKTFEDVRNAGRPIKMGGTATGSHSIDLPLLMNKMIGTRFTVVSGYSGTSKIRLAMLMKEVDGTCTNWESVIATARDMLDAKGDDKLIPFVIHSRLKEPEVKDLPLFNEVFKDKEHLATYKAYMAQMEYQRPLTVPPGTLRERLDLLRQAFKATLEDPEFLAEAKKLRLEITYVSGQEIEKIVNEVLSISPRVKSYLQFLVQGS